MECIFVESTIFEKHRDNYLSDEEFRLFQAELMSNPKQGDVIQGTGGLRKVRVASKGKGKREAPELSITSLMTNDAAICSQFMERVKCLI